MMQPQTLEARVAALELAVTGLARMTFEEERDDHGRWSSGGDDPMQSAHGHNIDGQPIDIHSGLNGEYVHVSDLKPGDTIQHTETLHPNAWDQADHDKAVSNNLVTVDGVRDNPKDPTDRYLIEGHRGDGEGTNLRTLNPSGASSSFAPGAPNSYRDSKDMGNDLAFRVKK
jgi:hypothetical protein